MIHQLTDKAIGVTFPVGATGFKVEQWIAVPHLIIKMPKTEDCDPDYYEPLPKGNWTIIGKASDLTEEQWGQIVGWFELAGKLGYRDYQSFDLSFPYQTASISGASLLKKHRVNPDTTLILIKQP